MSGRPKKGFSKKEISTRYSDVFKKAGNLKNLSASEKTQFFKNIYKQKMIDSKKSYSPDTPMKDITKAPRSKKKSRPFGVGSGKGAGGGSSTRRFLTKQGPTRKF